LFITIAGADGKFCTQLEALLRGQNHKVSVVPALDRVAPALQGVPPHLLVLVPGAESEDVAGLLKAIRDEAGLRLLPILCINPRAGSSEGVSYLDAGADDFINRPFNPQIFLARVRTLLRRRIWNGDLEEDEVTVLRSGPLVMNLVSRQALVAGTAVVLTRLEFDLLAFLVRNADGVLKREEILENVWNYPQGVATRTLDKHVETLRRKLGEWGSSIQTVHGIGYRLVGSPASSSTKGQR
jgi:two-component system alkaline phosphatase synthesis response regulator PhoP